jgi:serine/threonine-protein kinase
MSSPADQRPDTLYPDRTLDAPSGGDEQRLQSLFEEWALLREQGRDVPVAELCRDCPHLARALAREIALHRRFEPGPADGGQPLPPVKEFTGLRYQPVGYHAQGGLGVVFVARDSEVGREVALKQIQPRRQHLPQARQRFQREAEITGRLEHPGVVPVYSIGHDSSGQPYYTMRLIEGRTLAQAIEEFHAVRGRPTHRELRALLNRFVAVCQTIGYAHSRGVIHRDLKPSNILLGDYGETLVIDWGLARRLDDREVARPIGAEESLAEGSSPTQTGKQLGTWGFMSPEQARGDWDQVGPASDLFSLGATLFAILTGRPPSGMSPLEHGQGNFVRPRQQCRDVPPALEAICLKAMAAEPAERYPGALDLAADVQRWLDDEPTQAYREPLPVRLSRWGRRHRTMAAAGLVLLVASVLGLSLGLWAVGREQARTVAALQDSEANLERALQAEQDAKQNLECAQANLKLAKRAVDECFNVAKEHPVFQRPGMEKAKKSLLEKTLPFYKNFRAQRPDDPVLQREEAELWLRVAYIEFALGRYAEARQAYEQAGDLLGKLVKAHPEVPGYQNSLAVAYNGLGALLYTLGKPHQAAREYRQARHLQRRLVKAYPKAPEYQNALAGTHGDLGLLLHTLGKRNDALKEYEQARDLQRKLVESYPEEPEYQNALATTRNTLANLLSELGEYQKALAEYQQSCDLQRKLVESHPEVPWYQDNLAGTQGNRATLLASLGRRDEALVQYQQARGRLLKLVASHPELPGYQINLALLRNALGVLLADLGLHQEALTELQQSRDLLVKLVRDHPGSPWDLYFLARAHKDLGKLLADLGKHPEALAEYHQARRLQRTLVKDHPEEPWYRTQLAVTHSNLGKLLRAADRREQAWNELQHALDLRKVLAEGNPDVPAHQASLASTRNDLGQLLDDLGQRGEALKEYDQARELRQKLARARPELPGCIEGLARTCSNRGELLARMGRHHDSLDELDQAIALLDRLRRLDPRNPQVSTLLLFALPVRAAVLTQLDRRHDAETDWARALGMASPLRRVELLVQRDASRARAFVKTLPPAPER